MIIKSLEGEGQFIRDKKTAFSLIEISIVIVIIGLLLLGVIGSKHLVKKARISSAQAVTRSSVINGLLNNKLWLESSLDEIAFGDTYTTGDALSGWEDFSHNKTAIAISAVGSGPTYSNSINSVQAVKFGTSSATNHLQIDNPTFLNGTNYTIFITEKRMATNGSSGNYLLDSATGFALGYESGSVIIQTHGEAAADANQASIESLSAYTNKPRALVFTHSNSDGNNIYINGTLANTDTSSEAKAHLSGLSTTNTLKIGNDYNGEIGEIVIFDRDLKTVERRAVEDYLTDKWNAPNNRDLTSSCTSGTVTSSGCVQTCSAPTINGTTTSTTDDGDVAAFTCDDTGYAGNTLNYTCSSGSLSPTATASDCADVGCDSGYNSDDNECKLKCTLSSQTGLASNTLVLSGSTSQSCDEGYDGSITYDCDNDSLTSVTNSCVVLPAACSSATDDTPIIFGSDTLHIFSTVGSHTLTCTGNLTAKILVVAGGGGGGGVGGGGGGAGGVLYDGSYSIVADDYTVVVGDGGIGGNGHPTTEQDGKGGENSSFVAIAASGGGGGGGMRYSDNDEINGGSGGGESGDIDFGGSGVGTGVSGQGYDGGGCLPAGQGCVLAGGGGGGAGSVGGTSAAGDVSGDGGSGVDYSSIFGSAVGDYGWFSSGGGGGAHESYTAGGSATIGGGGDGINATVGAENGADGTGGGGGGAGYDVSTTDEVGGVGGSGIVIVSYPTP